VTLTSLSTADFSDIEDTVRTIVEDPAHSKQVSVSLPSLRVDAFTVGTAAQIQQVRRTGLTFAPKGAPGGCARYQQAHPRGDLYAAVDAAFSQGWRRVKLLPDRPADRDGRGHLGIAELGRRCVEIGHSYHRSVTVTASVGGFVPKPQTPFQWFGQDTIAELRRKINLLRDATRGVRGSHCAARARGDRRRGHRHRGTGARVR